MPGEIEVLFLLKFSECVKINIFFRVFLPSLVGSTDTPGEEILNLDSVKMNDYGVFGFGDDGKQVNVYLYFNSFKIRLF